MNATPFRRNGPWPNRPAWPRRNPFAFVCARACACTCAGVVLAGDVGVALAGAPSPADLIRSFSVPRGIIVCVGEGATASALALARETEFIVYCQFTDVATAEAERRAIDRAGFYGTRVFVGEGDSNHLLLADDIADGLVAASGALLPEPEALRVVRPGGKVWLGDRQLTKPIPAGIDDWSHPYHGPDNNPVSRDQVIRAPYLTQFLADPRYAPLPQVAVAAGGRVFKAFGHIAFKLREEPWLNTLAAFNGYNGTLLWQRAIPPGIMVHRNTLIATPTAVYYGDDTSCKVYDAATGELREEMVPPAELTDGTFWKWMALEGGVLYALVGQNEQRDPVVRPRLSIHGWPWDPLSPGFNQPTNPWGYGRTLLAMDLRTRRVLWHYREEEPMDSRALCLKNGRLYAFRFGAYLTCLDTATGKVIWRHTKGTTPDLFRALGSYLQRQGPWENWRTTAYLKCNDQALYFAGPCMNRLLALAASDGRVLWSHPYNNYQLLLLDDAVVGISGTLDSAPSRRFHPFTGDILSAIKVGRMACTRPTAYPEAVFFRCVEGSTRLDLATDRPQLVSPMRAQCHDGVTIAHGRLYWWPSVCDCNLTLYGITCLGPAGDFAFSQQAIESERLEVGEGLAGAAHPAVGPEPPSLHRGRPDTDGEHTRPRVSRAAPSPVGSTSPSPTGLPDGARPAGATTGALVTRPEDWPTFRADNTGSTTSAVAVPEVARLAWQTRPTPGVTPTSPTAVGDRVFVAGSDGMVRAFDASTGQPAWTAFTGGAVLYPPTIGEGRALVGAGDGWTYALDARTGQRLWRFRAAPSERRIPVYGSLRSTWPAASGVLLQDGLAYVAAGIVNYDGTHVYALDAATGRIRWQNHSSGHLDPESRTGVSVQGHLGFLNGKLYLPGGNALSPAVYDAATGQCLNDTNQLHQTVANDVPWTTAPRGAELIRIENQMFVSGKPLYSHPQYPVFDETVLNKVLVTSTRDRDVLWVSRMAGNLHRVLCFSRIEDQRERRLLSSWTNGVVAGVSPVWWKLSPGTVAFALAQNAALVATTNQLRALALSDGTTAWSFALPAPPVPWGLAVNRHGSVLLALEDGRLLAIGPALGPLLITRDADDVVLSWNGAGRLQVTSSLTPAVWTDLAGAASPHRLHPVRGERYYRLAEAEAMALHQRLK